MPEPEIHVPFPLALPGTGDTVIYSNKDIVGPSVAAATRPLTAGPVQSGERNMNAIVGWFQANQDALVKIQSWDSNANAWVTVNNDGNGNAAPAAGGPADITAIIYAGWFQIVVNFAVAPTVWRVPRHWRLFRDGV